MAFGVVWVGGGGYLMYRYPEFFAKLNARFRLKSSASPNYIVFTRRLGIIEMILVALGVIGMLVMHIFGVKGY
jgi:hypothetical protein